MGQSKIFQKIFIQFFKIESHFDQLPQGASCKAYQNYLENVSRTHLQNMDHPVFVAKNDPQYWHTPMQLHHVPTFCMSFQASIIGTMFSYLQIQKLYTIALEYII